MAMWMRLEKDRTKPAQKGLRFVQVMRACGEKELFQTKKHGASGFCFVFRTFYENLWIPDVTRKRCENLFKLPFVRICRGTICENLCRYLL